MSTQPLSPLTLSADAKPVLSHFGEERQPLLVLDNALPDLELVRQIAARHRYQPIGPFYPGIRAAVSKSVVVGLIEPIVRLLEAAFNLPRAPEYCECYLSLVTRSPAQLEPIQRLPHFDGVEPERIAVLLYLSDDRAGGTAFYRQRSTGLESVDAARFEQYRAQLQVDTDTHGLPPAGYIGTDSPLFERFHKVDGRANRLIAYRGNVLHCAALEEGFVPSADPLRGRLTLNLFLR